MARIEPLGVAELKVVRQRLVRYTAGEIAHVENVLAGETRSREHRRLRRFEVESERETDRTEESIRDLQSTERLEVEKEASEIVRSESRFNVGLSVSGSYGPVSATLNSDYSMSDTSEISQREAEKYGREVVERTVARISERVRSLRREKSLEESEETNTHAFEGRESNITGIYRWLDKTYRAKVITYGKRLLYQFIVPEPALIYIERTLRAAAGSSLPVAPQAPTDLDGNVLQPEKITRDNYRELIALANVVDVAPPPPQWVAVSGKLVAECQDDDGFWTATDSVDVPDGYEARWVNFESRASWSERSEDHSYTIVVGDRVRWLADDDTSGGYGPLSLRLEDDDGTVARLTGTLPVVASGWGIRTVISTINVVCKVSEERFQQWQLEVWRAIVEQYRREHAAYEERLAAAKLVGDLPFGSQNPEINRALERDALRHACLAMWSGDALDPGPDPIRDPVDEDSYSTIRRSAALTRATTIDFLERAFDWANMSYEFLPYYWGRPTRWGELVSGSNPDPLFDAFLTAGAARVLVPVRRGEEGRLLYYRCTEVIWPDADIPALRDTGDAQADLYEEYLDELPPPGEDEDEVDEEILADDSSTFLVVVPTTLVWLQPDSTLPDLEPA